MENIIEMEAAFDLSCSAAIHKQIVLLLSVSVCEDFFKNIIPIRVLSPKF